MKIFGKTFNKKALIISIAILLVLISLIITLVIISHQKSNNSPSDQLTVILKDDLTAEINSETTLLSFVSEDNQAEIVSEDEKIDTSVLGDKELTITYMADGKEKIFSFTVQIIDTIAPIIDCKDTLSTSKGTEIDLLSDVTVSDNSGEEITAVVEGTYDFGKVGEYALKYVAADSSGNKAEKDFTLTVSSKETSSSNNQTSGSTSGNTQSSGNSSSAGKTYSTAWGTRPYEFQEVYRETVFGPWTWHCDRYGNVWWDNIKGPSSGIGKYIYRHSVLGDLDWVFYFGNGRWCANGFYWDQDGTNVGSFQAGYNTCWPSNWGSSYEEFALPKDMPLHSDIYNYLGVIMDYHNHPSGTKVYLPDGTLMTQEIYDAVLAGGYLKLPYSPYVGK